MLDIQNITYRIQGRTLLEETSLQINPGDHTALVGRNGIGKSTLFRLILGLDAPDQGEIKLQKDIKIGTVAQEIPGGDGTPLEFVLGADAEYVSLMQRTETETDPQAIADLYDRLLEIDAYTAEARASKILLGLGFSSEAQSRPLNTFSGGWRMRIALAAALFLEPDLLLLDEPSNHLDLEATVWLTNFLRAYPKAFLLISHDRHILNAVSRGIFHIHNRAITFYKGNYDAYENAFMERKAQLEAAAVQQARERAHQEKFINRFRAAASKARMVQSRLKRLEKLQEVQLVRSDPTVTLKFPDPKNLAPPLLSLENASVGYDGVPILERLNQRIDPDDRIALLGQNGNGKSTFAKLIAGTLAPLKGERQVYNSFKVAFFEQYQLEALPLEMTPLSYMMTLLPDPSVEKVRAYLSQYGLVSHHVETLIGDLSGGEKTRLTFAALAQVRPELLILDEPTNHLDMETRESLALAINKYKGAVILITHDFQLLDLTMEKYWVVHDGRVTHFDGDLEDYTRQVLGIKGDADLGHVPKEKTKGSKKKK